MDKSFDFNALLKQQTKKHKRIPEQFTSVEGGVQNRLLKSLKNRRSSRLSVFDSLRNLPKCESLVPKISTATQKLEHRKQQLEKWKLEKEQKKKEEAKNKKKPFLVGVAHVSQRYLPPPPPPTKTMPSTSGRITRSQSSKTTINSSKLKTETSFAPPNTIFRPPQLKNLTKLPVLAPISKKSKKMSTTICFDPILPKKTQKADVNRTIATMPTISERVTKTAPKMPVVVEHKRVTRSRAVHLKSKSEINIPKPKITKKIETSTSTSSLELSSSLEKSPVLKLSSRRSSRQSISRTPRNSIPKSESSSEEKLRSPKNVLDAPLTPAQIAEVSKKISPCVTLSRGKTNARNEMKKKMEEGLLDEDASSESVEHFHRQLASETDRINAMCDSWDDISHKITLPDHVQEAVLSAVGQARLLVAQKFQQFAALLARARRPPPNLARVTPADLAGFWDMLFLQVENVDMRFKKLEELRASGWQERDVVRPEPTKLPARRLARPAATSRIRDIIAAARKAKQQQAAPAPSTDENKTFEAGFFCVRSPVQSPVVTPHKHTLLKAVLSSEAKKASASKNSASLAMLRASMISKDVETDSYQTTPTRITPVNTVYATPARSILKSAKKETARKSTRKSVKVVLFGDSDTDIQNSSNSDLYQNAVENKIANTPKTAEDLKENEEHNSVKRKSKLIRQSAVDERSPVQTRNRRKSLLTTTKVAEDPTPVRSSRKKVLHELQDNAMEEKCVVTPKRTSRRRKSSAAV